MLKQIALIFIALSTIAAPLSAADKSALVVSSAQARASVGKMPHTAAFLQIDNQGKSEDVLLSASSPAAASVDIHAMTMEGDVMKMRSVESIAIKPGEKITMQPGQGYHLMLMGLKKPLTAGEKISLTLIFRHAGKLKISADVIEMKIPGKHGDPQGADKSGNMHEHHNH